MKHSLRLGLKLQMRFFLAIIALIFAPAVFPQSNARITVCVNDDNTSSPIAGANLELFRQGISQGKTVTGGDGCAVFEVVITGIDDRDDSPIKSFQLAPIYPNPSSHAINFEMFVSRAGI